MRSEPEIVVGLSISLTGQFAQQGQQALAGIRLWQFYVNAHGGIPLGTQSRRTVRLVYYDDQSRSSLARQNALRLLQQDRVAVLFGPYSSVLTLTVAEIAEEHRKLLWNHGGSSDDISNRGYRYLVSTASPASDYLRGLPNWLARTSPSLKRICIAHSARGTFGPQVARGLLEAARALGVHSVETVPLSPPPETTDAVVRELLSLRHEVLVLAATFQDEVGLLRTRPLWPDTIREVAAVAAGVQAFYQELDIAAEGVVGPSQWEPAPESRAELHASVGQIYGTIRPGTGVHRCGKLCHGPGFGGMPPPSRLARRRALARGCGGTRFPYVLWKIPNRSPHRAPDWPSYPARPVAARPESRARKKRGTSILTVPACGFCGGDCSLPGSAPFLLRAFAECHQEDGALIRGVG